MKEGAAGRYQLHGEIARGGMGVIFKGHDNDLGRDVAVKVLLEDRRDDAGQLQRFVEEAQIAGQLQHPGIAPVYELGQLPDRRPYFSMKLVKGQTLASLLTARTDLAEDRPKFVGVFQQVCQTLAYAHARGVIHRDLKPANVMVGAFGEVQVMDWGLAKVLHEGGVTDPAGGGRQPPADLSVIRTARSSGSDAPEADSGHTRAGSVLGTPAYMAPEQARGDIDLVDERTDVFGLGAILCEILSGKPPFPGKGAESLRKAQTGQLGEALAGLDQCGADADLIALAKRCLAVEPWDRVRDAGVVAQEVTACLHSVEARLRQAELERTAAEVKTREERKRRKLTVGLAAAVLALVLVGGSGALWLWRQADEHRAETARQEAERRRDVQAALEKAAELEKQARWAEARAELDRAGQRLDGSSADDLRRRVAQRRADLLLVSRLDEARLQMAMLIQGQLNWRSAARDYAVAFREAKLGQPGEDVGTVAARVRRSAVREQLVAALDHWARITRDRRTRAWLLAVARQADPDPWRNRFRNPAVWRDRAALQKLAGEARVDQLSPPLLAILGSMLAQRGGDGVGFLTAAREQYPQDFWLNFRLGNMLRKAKKSEKAIAYYRVALALRPETNAVYNNLGLALGAQGDMAAAIAALKKSIALNPAWAAPHYNLGTVLQKQGDVAGASACYQKAIALNPKLAGVCNTIGNFFFAQGRLDEAMACYRKALKIDPRYALAHHNLGLALYNKGRKDEAIACYRQALALNPRYSQAQDNLAHALKDKGRLDEAIACYQKILALDPKNIRARNKLQQCERFLALAPKLPAILQGEAQPASPAERIDYALLCRYKQFYLASARLFTEAFAADPKLADDLTTWNRYNAACHAILAAQGQGKDASPLDARERAHWRQQALNWLRADLALWNKTLASGQPQDRARVRRTMQHWQRDFDLAGIRDQSAVAQLPVEEQKALRQLWEDVALLLQKTHQGKEGAARK
jgi:serine/threonine-protein kinase